MSRLAALSVFFLLSQFICVAQTPIAPGTAAPATVPEPPLPIPIQIKKNVVFLNTSCVHDFTNELRALKSQLEQMPVQQKVITLQELTSFTSRLAQIPQSLAKLN